MFIFLLIPLIFCSCGRSLPLSSLTQSAVHLYREVFEPGRVRQIHSLLQKYAHRGQFNGNVLVVSGGVTIYLDTFGLADAKKRKPLTLDSVFQVASLSKQFTAMAVMILQEEGRLNYDQSVSRHLPSWPYPRVTLRHLLNHTAGLPNYMWLVEHRWPRSTPPYNDDILDLLITFKPGLNFSPGTRFHYDNTGYAILALVVEKITGRYFHEFVEKRIFDPLGMKDSFVYSRVVHPRHVPDGVVSHRRRGRRYKPLGESIHDGVVGDKGVYSTLRDLRRWDRSLQENPLVSSQTLEQAFTRLVLQNHYRWHYGFGFRIRGQDENKRVYHFGQWNGYHTYMGHYLKNRDTIILLSNTGSPVKYLVRGIEKILARSTDSPRTRP